MPDDTVTGIIQIFLDDLDDDYVCAKQIFDGIGGQMSGSVAKRWELKEVNDVMNNSITGWKKCAQRRFPKYGQQRAWERIEKKTDENGFMVVPEQMRLPFDEAS